MTELAPLARDRLVEARELLAHIDPQAARVAEEKLFGDAPVPSEATAALDDGRLVGLSVVSGRWLRVLAVAPDARGQGVGSALLAAAERRALTWGSSRLRAADQPGNYLSPGVDERDTATLGWLERRGFTYVGTNENLRVPLVGNPRVTPERAAAAAAGHRIRRATPADAPALAVLCDALAAPTWGFEAGLALSNTPPTLHLAFGSSDDHPVAFACIDANNRGLGWFGPAGTLPDHRGRGLGEALLLACLLDAMAAGYQEATIAWIGPRAFYERACGALAGTRYVALAKELSP